MCGSDCSAWKTFLCGHLGLFFSFFKDNEIVGLRKTLEALREEADEKVDPSSNTSSPHVIIQTRHGQWRRGGAIVFFRKDV